MDEAYLIQKPIYSILMIQYSAISDKTPNMIWLRNMISGACLTVAYDVTIQRCRNSYAKMEYSKNTYFAVRGFKILFEISKVSFEISHKIWNPYTAQYAFYEMLKI